MRGERGYGRWDLMLTASRVCASDREHRAINEVVRKNTKINIVVAEGTFKFDEV